MTTIVRDPYPVAKLPRDLQDAVGGAEAVRLTIETRPTRPGPSLRELFDQVKELHLRGVIKPVTAEEAVARIRALRDEWDD